MALPSRPVPFVFEDSREIQKQGYGTQIKCSRRDAARKHWLDIITSSEHDQEHEHEDEQELEQRDRPLSPSPQEVDVGAASVVVRLDGMLASEDHVDDELFYKEYVDDIAKEVCKYGELLEVVIPRLGDPAVGKVFLKYACLDDSIRCRSTLDGRWYCQRMIVAEY